MSNLWLRTLSALILAPIFLVIVWLGGAPLKHLVFLIGLVSYIEWFGITNTPKVVISTVCAAVLLGLGLYITTPGMAILGLYAGSVAFISWGKMLRLPHPYLYGIGVGYIGVFCISFLYLRSIPETGLHLLVFGLLCIWATDIGGYFVGKNIGGPKLAPKISPSKTWSGFFGGILASSLFAYSASWHWGLQKPIFIIALGAMLAVFGQLGDLFESYIKRRFQVKDSSQIIPGHGGVLDRIDGLLLALPLLASYHAIMGGIIGW